MNRLILLIVVTLLATSKAYSQKVLIDGESLDTTICFTIPQSRFLLKNHYQNKEARELLSICENTNLYHQEIIRLKDSSLVAMGELAENNAKSLIISKNEILNLKITTKKLEISLQNEKKNHFWYALGGGVVGFLGLLLTTR